MIFDAAPQLPLFLGPVAFLLAALVVMLLVLMIARVVFSLAWRVVVFGAIVLGVLWLIGAVGIGSPGL